MGRGSLRSAFTLIEVLLSIGLMGIVMTALFSSVMTMRESNKQLYNYLEKADLTTKATRALYLDLVTSDGDLELESGDFAQLCIPKTKNSLYGLSLVKVCWVVLQETNSLVRIEGNHFHLPVDIGEMVDSDIALEHVELFDVASRRGTVTVAIGQKGAKPMTFSVHGPNFIARRLK